MIKHGKIHGHYTIIKIIDGVPHIADKEKGKFKWCPTIITPDRLKKFRPVSEEELADKLMKAESLIKRNKISD